MELIPGVYETLISVAIERKLQKLQVEGFLVKKDDIDGAESCKILSNYLGEVVCQILKNEFNKKMGELSLLR